MKITKLSKNRATFAEHILSEELATEENLTEASEAKLPELSDVNITALFNSKEFKTPISEEEAESYLK